MIALSPSVIKAHLVDRADPSPPPPGLLPSGVLVPLYWEADTPYFLFTQRSYTMRDHQGQISFPGGVRDPRDPDLLTTALRETEEEIALKPEVVEVLGRLEPVATVTGYWILPFVGLIPYPYEFRINPREVRKILTFPLPEFFPARRWSTGDYRYRGKVVRVCCWRYQETVIWGATARIVVNFLIRLGKNPLSVKEEETRQS
uniref:CoA pyrophosphatase n=1 Tax=Desulfobacca acetoxidans TaxID=60893 RepID=A0A7C5ALU3_9BACT